MGIIKEFVYRLRGEYTTEKLIKMGLKVGKNFQREGGVILDPSHCWLISIGNDVIMAPRVHVLCHDASTCKAIGYAKVGNVIIGDEVFIGAESIILPNVHIGNRVVIGAGSVVSKNIPDNSVAVGNPAKVVMSYDDYIQKNKYLLEKNPVWGEEYTLRNDGLDGEKKQEMVESLNKFGIGYVK